MGHKSIKSIKVSTPLSAHQLFTKVLLQINQGNSSPNCFLDLSILMFKLYTSCHTKQDFYNSQFVPGRIIST